MGGAGSVRQYVYVEKISCRESRTFNYGEFIEHPVDVFNVTKSFKRDDNNDNNLLDLM